MNRISTLVKTIRAPFLILTPICVFLGVSIVLYQQNTIDITSLILALLAALFAHISVNMFNEYLDFKSGLDFQTQRTPFSGGSGALLQNPNMQVAVFYFAMLSLMITVLIGGYFIIKFGVGIMPMGLIGLFLVISYTNWINKYPLLCIIAPGLGFSLFVVGTQYVLVGEYYNLTWLLALIPFFLVNNLLLLNQYPDIEADRQVGRNHFPIAFGIRLSNVIYGIFVLLTIITIISLALLKITPILSLIALLPLPLSLFSLFGASKYGEAIGQHTEYMASNVVVTLLVPLLLGVSLIVGVE